MKHFLIKYRLQNASPEEWHREVARFIADLESDPELAGKIAYRSMKAANGPEYYHLASGGTVEVLPLEIVAQTSQ